MSSDTLLRTQPPLATEVADPESWLWEPEPRQPEKTIGAIAIEAPIPAPSAGEVTPDFVSAAYTEARDARQSVDPRGYDDLRRSTVEAARLGQGLGSVATELRMAMPSMRPPEESNAALVKAMKAEAPQSKQNILQELGYDNPQHEELVFPERFAVKALRGAIKTLRSLRPRLPVHMPVGSRFAH